MMSPEDILIESIIAADREGDSLVLRKMQCRKLAASLRAIGIETASEFSEEGYRNAGNGNS